MCHVRGEILKLDVCLVKTHRTIVAKNVFVTQKCTGEQRVDLLLFIESLDQYV